MIKKSVLFSSLVHIISLSNIFYAPKDIEIFRRIERDPRKRHSSAPYISGDTFRSICDHIFDETNLPIDTDAIISGDIVFVIPPYFPYFFAHIYPEIKVPIILLSHNSDYSVPGDFKKYIDDEKIIAWFSTNVDMEHTKLFPIPIGLPNNYWPHGKTSVIAKMRAQMPQKDKLLYLNFSPTTHASRKKVINMFKHKPFCYVGQNKPYHAFIYDVARSKFVLSPQGAGIDCHRTWEALLLGAIPIVPSTTINKLYEGLPVLIVDDWNMIIQEYLDEKWLEFQEKEFTKERMMADYWLDMIKNVQEQHLNS